MQGQALLIASLANELRAAQDLSHPMRYLMRKTSPRLTTTRQIYETKDGAVSRLISTNDKPLSAADEQKEQTRLAQLALDPGRQRRRKQGEDSDRARALKVLRLLPTAFLYVDAGPVTSANGTMEKFTFKPNPSFDPPDIETQALTEMTGEIWVSPTEQRVTLLEGHLQDDVDFGWGVLGRLYKGGWIRLTQGYVGNGQWRVIKFEMQMNARVVWKTRNFTTTELESEYVPLPAGIGYQEAIDELKAEQQASR